MCDLRLRCRNHEITSLRAIVAAFAARNDYVFINRGDQNDQKRPAASASN